MNPLPTAVFLLLSLASRAAETPEAPKPKITLSVTADYLALHIKGSVTPPSAVLEHRLTLASKAQPESWTPSAVTVRPDGDFSFDLPLPEWRWTRLEMRAVRDGQALASAETSPRNRPLVMITPEGLASLPQAERTAWDGYLAESARRAEQERDVLATECRQLQMAFSKAAPGISAEFEMDSDLAIEWYATPENARLAETVLSYQTPSGAWSKAVDYAQGARARGTHWTNNAENPWHYCGTLDNRSTTEQIKFLARVHRATQNPGAKVGALRGMEWLLTAQFPNGGWPQVYPLEPGYHEAITLNDGAMQHAMEVLLAASQGEEPFTFLDDSLRQRAAAAFSKAVACLMACQVKVGGTPGVWCAQHHPLTLEPAAARLKEPPSLSGAESAEMIKFLMRKGPDTPAVVSMIEHGLTWLAANKITGLRKTKTPEEKTDYVSEPASREIYWARFYDVSTGQPMFAGAQDGVVYASFQEMAKHNKVAYDYFTAKPADILEKEVPRWRKRLAK